MNELIPFEPITWDNGRKSRSDDDIAKINTRLQLITDFLCEIPIKIRDFSINEDLEIEVGTLGNSITLTDIAGNKHTGEIVFNCSFLGTPQEIILPGEYNWSQYKDSNYDVLSTVYIYTAAAPERFLEPIKYTIRVKDKNNNLDTRDIIFTPNYRFYCGVDTIENVINAIPDKDYISKDNTPYGFRNLTKILKPNRIYNQLITTREDEYIWYVSPVQLGGCTFAINNILTGFILVDTITLTTVDDYQIDYYIYRSLNDNLGEVNFNVS